MSSPLSEIEGATEENVEKSRVMSVEEEDPLVIDEENEKSKEKEKPEGEGEAIKDPDEDNEEKEFEPTVDMLMNEFDDEATIDEEEAMDQEDEADELSALQDEQDMPIEELLKMYGGAGYTQPPDDDAKEKEEDEGGDAQCENKDVDENTSKEVTTDDKTLEKGEPTKEAFTVSSVAQTDEEPEILSKGEKRSSSTPPPAKKSRSELAKFYEATIEGRSLRSSAGVVGDEEEEEEEEEPEELPAWKKTIMIGPSYQASVPGGLNNYDDTPPYENEDKLIWDPSRISSDTIKEYLAKSGEVQGASGVFGVNGIPNGSHIRDDEQALLLLLQCGYNTDEALRRRRMNAVPPADTMSLWSEDECKAFETGLRVYGKDFHSIQNQKVGTRSVGELVQFYYLWKKTERHDVFANSFRIEKKKYTLHPGTTDYMERFMDEQDVARDRSISPNYHSIIYGESKKSEVKNNELCPSNRGDKQDSQGEDATLNEASILQQ